MSNAQKLQAIIEQIEQLNFSVRDFLHTLALERSQSRLGKYWNQYRRFAYQDFPRGDGLMPAFDDCDWDSLLEHGASDRLEHHIRKELVKLGKDPRCGKFQYPKDNSSGYHEHLDTIRDIVMEKAPRLLDFLITVTRQKRRGEGSPSELSQRHTFWVQQMLFDMQRSKCGGFAKTMAIYLIDGGAKRHVIDSLSTLGVCCSYGTAHSILNELVSRARDQVRSIGSLPNCILTYDNFEFPVNKSTESLGNRKEFRSITTLIAVRGIKIPENGLQQSMWRPHVPLKIGYICLNSEQATTCFKQVC